MLSKDKIRELIGKGFKDLYQNLYTSSFTITHVQDWAIYTLKLPYDIVSIDRLCKEKGYTNWVRIVSRLYWEITSSIDTGLIDTGNENIDSDNSVLFYNHGEINLLEQDLVGKQV